MRLYKIVIKAPNVDFGMGCLKQLYDNGSNEDTIGTEADVIKLVKKGLLISAQFLGNSYDGT